MGPGGNPAGRLAADAALSRTAREAAGLADELGCDVIPAPGRPGRVEARDPGGAWLMIGTPEEIRAAVLEAPGGDGG